MSTAKQHIPISYIEVDRLRENGFELFEGGDAAKANGNHFALFVKRDEEGGLSEFVVLCPTFLRGRLKFSKHGGVSY